MPIWYPSGNVQWTVRCTCLELKREVGAGDVKMGTVSICVVFQARKLGKITEGVKINREEVEGWCFGLLGEMMRIQQMKPRKSERWIRKKTKRSGIYERGSNHLWQMLLIRHEIWGLRIDHWIQQSGGCWGPGLEPFWWRGGGEHWTGWISVRARQEELETARVLTLWRNFAVKGKRERKVSVKGDVAHRRLLFEVSEHVWVPLRMIQGPGKADEVGQRGDNRWEDILELGSEEAPRAQTEDCPYTRVKAGPMGPVSRLEPCDGRVRMRPADCFRFLSEMRNKVICWQWGKGKKLEVGGGRRCNIYTVHLDSWRVNSIGECSQISGYCQGPPSNTRSWTESECKQSGRVFFSSVFNRICAGTNRESVGFCLSWAFGRAWW